jgi:hypothetical protein
MAMATRPLITLTLRPLPGIDPTRALRRLLRYAFRSCGLRCTSIRCDAQPLQNHLANISTHTRQNE